MSKHWVLCNVGKVLGFELTSKKPTRWQEEHSLYPSFSLWQNRGVNSSTLAFSPPARFHARFVNTLWLEKCLIQRQWCGHVARPDEVWEQQRTETILEEKPQQQFISVSNCPHLMFMVQQVDHIPRRGQGKFCTVPGIKRPTFFVRSNQHWYLYNIAQVFWGILPKNEYEPLLVGRVGGKTPKYIG